MQKSILRSFIIVSSLVPVSCAVLAIFFYSFATPCADCGKIFHEDVYLLTLAFVVLLIAFLVFAFFEIASLRCSIKAFLAFTNRIMCNAKEEVPTAIRHIELNSVATDLTVVFNKQQNYLDTMMMNIRNEHGNADSTHSEVLDGANQKSIEQELRKAKETAEKMCSVAFDSNPITGLPGNNTIVEHLNDAIENNALVCVMYVDLDYFKAYNDKYGFIRGDDVIAFTSELLRAATMLADNSFLGHVGGDDFIIITPSQTYKKIARYIVDEFDASIRTLYDKADAEAGFIDSIERDGTGHRFPIMSVSVGVVDLSVRKFNHYLEINAICAEVKSRAKEIEGSGFYVERRRKQ